MKLKWKSFGNHFRRAGALLFALLMICCITVPALATNNWPYSPDSLDFYSHPNTWYVWKRTVLRGVGGYELICTSMNASDDADTVKYPFPFSYSTNSGTYSYTNSNSLTKTFMYATPYIPASLSGSWENFPSFPVGDPSNTTAAVRLYPSSSGFYSNGLDPFSDRSVFCFLTSWPSTASTAITDHYDHEAFTVFPVYIPTNIFFFGHKTDTSSNHTGFGIVDGDNDFWASPTNSNYLHLSESHYSNLSYTSFPSNFSIPSSDIGLVFAKQPEGNQMHPYNTEFNVNDLRFVAALWVPDSLLPANVAIGDWISKATVEDMQDDLVNEFGVDSDTLKNSKQNFDSWQNSNTIDTDVADTGLNIINALMQNVGQFAFVVSLLCFGAVVLRVLIRKAVEG